ncbi:hypothetical protein AGMMS49992_16870 [Clostridia bacterium]|nr:hypothetical protein AGMMS49992_16870 [Clostridia bacterium]
MDEMPNEVAAQTLEAAQIHTEQEQPSARSPFETLIANDTGARAELDRRISKALDTGRVKWEREAAMTADERARHAIEERESTLIERERLIARRELQADAVRTLTERKLPVWLLDALDYSGGDELNASIERFAQSYEHDRNEDREALRRELLRGQPPKATSGSMDTRNAAIRRYMGLPESKGT